MRSVDIHEAKTHLSRLVEEAAQGQPFIIAKAGKPMVKVVAIAEEGRTVRSRIGFLDGLFPSLPDEFDTLSEEEIIRMFESEDAA